MTGGQKNSLFEFCGCLMFSVLMLEPNSFVSVALLLKVLLKPLALVARGDIERSPISPRQLYLDS